MEELIEKVEKLKESLNQSEPVQEIIQAKEEMMKETELLEMIQKYKEKQDESIKEEIIKNKKYREYKKKETDLNILIMEINQELKKLTKGSKDCHESH